LRINYYIFLLVFRFVGMVGLFCWIVISTLVEVHSVVVYKFPEYDLGIDKAIRSILPMKVDKILLGR